MRDLLIKNKNLRELLKSESNINKETIEMFIENSSLFKMEVIQKIMILP